MTRRTARAVVALAALAIALPASASAAEPPAPPLQLPGDASTAGVRADGSTWIVGARPGDRGARIAGAYGARHIGPQGTGGYAVATGKARAFAGALRAHGLLMYAQPNVLRRTTAMPKDPLDVTNPWRDSIVDPTLTPPVVTPTSPLIALVDASADVTHPELAGHTTVLRSMPIVNPHGTATASVASASANGVGLTGVWPGARTLNVPLDEQISCSDSANGITDAIKAGAAVVNMSYGSAQLCEPELVAIQFAVAQGIVPVAAAGNEFAAGNPLEFPASLPHVITVGAIGPDNKAAYFSNANIALDLAAPGEGISIAVPPALDADGDGYAVADGTSFAAPMVSAAIAWVRAARPTLQADQVANAVRYSAQDLGSKGYDSSTGYGRLDLAAALVRKPSLHDPGEPNDDIPWVNGAMFGQPAPVIYQGRGKAVHIAATLDAVEDPDDVYRVKVRPHGRVRLTATPAYGHITMRTFSSAAKSLSQRKHRIGRSARSGNHAERLTLVNPSAQPRSYFVALDVANGNRLDAGYVLRAGRD
jgi:Subtilase family